eukprot:COSAG05_NODE_528_length_8915_cov_26.504651_10_plen_68_part_00
MCCLGEAQLGVGPAVEHPCPAGEKSPPPPLAPPNHLATVPTAATLATPYILTYTAAARSLARSLAAP